MSYIIALVIFAFCGVLLLLSLVMYVIGSLGMYKLAKNRNCNLPFFAWIPFLNTWTLGDIADKEQLHSDGVDKKQRIKLMALQVVLVLLYVFIFIGYLISTIDYDLLLIFSIVSIVFGLIMLAVAIVLSVLMYICYYKIFKAIAPDKAVIFIIISIVCQGAIPFLVFYCAKNDPAELRVNDDFMF